MRLDWRNYATGIYGQFLDTDGALPVKINAKAQSLARQYNHTFATSHLCVRFTKRRSHIRRTLPGAVQQPLTNSGDFLA